MSKAFWMHILPICLLFAGGKSQSPFRYYEDDFEPGMLGTVDFS
jgi:hypothetical protein